MMRVGFGKDIHKLVSFRKLFLGGIEIPSPLGEMAHSDGDVVIHSLCDAILGALALGDIGKYFPSDDHKYDDISSKEILLFIISKMKKQKFGINNIDISIELEKPHLSEYIDLMRDSLAELCGISKDKISIKAMTNEGFGSTGKMKSIISYCIVLLEDNI
jgi:2-C-methyl-D-erythritol 2,4-cyclodiphosphate synthase